jgi:hypothetical protein
VETVEREPVERLQSFKLRVDHGEQDPKQRYQSDIVDKHVSKQHGVTVGKECKMYH